MRLILKLYFIFLSFLIFFSFFYYFYLSLLPHQIENPLTTIIKPSPTILPTILPTPKIIKTKITPTDDPTPWGIAKQVDEHTWTMKIGEDPVMATPTEILNALNAYRQRYDAQVLTMDTKLTAYAQGRVDYFNEIKNIDAHAGFNNFLQNENGFNKLGFGYLGENISYGYRLNGVHLIEWVYAGDEPHNKNQLDTKWDHVGIAVKGTATCLIFATGKM